MNFYFEKVWNVEVRIFSEANFLNKNLYYFKHFKKRRYSICVENVWLKFAFVGAEVCCHSMSCCFDSSVAWNTCLASSYYSYDPLLRIVSKRATNRPSVSLSKNIFVTQRTHNFRYFSVSCLSSLIFSSTAPIKS